MARRYDIAKTVPKTVEKSITDSGDAYARSDSDFERSKINLKENKPDGTDLNSNGLATAFERTKEKFYDFRQTELVPTEVKSGSTYVK